MRVVLDTNVLIDALSDDFSAQAKLLNAARDGSITALATPALEREYRKIARRLVTNDAGRERIRDFIEHTEQVTEERVEVVLDDLEDLKFLKAAAGGQAHFVVTNDHHLLDIGEFEGIRIVRPMEMVTIWQEETGSSDEWAQWATGLGIGS
jgi:putative PIN family toxin of toxin-antitoxin system